jgi:hypothetical protein
VKALQVIESAYRCTLEEQDDPVVWITHAMKGSGANLDVLLRGNAVNYAVRNQDASGLVFGGLEQTNPPQLERDIRQFAEKGVDVYVVEDDAAERGIGTSEFLNGVKPLPREEIAKLFSGYDQIWHW